MKRMLKEDVVDPLRAGDARDTFNLRRAALHVGVWNLLTRELEAFDRAANEHDRKKAGRAIRALQDIVERCEPVIRRYPPMDRSASSFVCEPSAWTSSAIPHPRRGKGSKKFVLPQLPAGWMATVWEAAGEDWPYLDALAIHMLTPARPAEFVAGDREGRWIPGIGVALIGSVLAIAIAPVKSHGGKFGTGRSDMRFDANSLNPAVRHLVERCRSADRGAIVISLPGTNGMRKAVEKLGRKALGDGVKITPYVFRQQAIADLKKTFGAGAVVAAAAGHSTDRTQSHYGRVEHGRRRPDLLGVTAKREPRVGNIERTRALSDARRSTMLPRSPVL